MQLPSRLLSANCDVMRLLRPCVKPGDRFLEIGCAPGKILSWVGAKLGATVAGVDYSPRGVVLTRQLMRAVGVNADIREEDIFQTTFPPESFDVVYSAGVIEHFEDPRVIVARHLQLTRPGGTTLITVPNFSGVHARVMYRFDPEGYKIHNLEIMSLAGLRSLVSPSPIYHVNANFEGRFSISRYGIEKRLPRVLYNALFAAANLIGLLQPMTISCLASSLLLQIKKSASA